MKRFFNEYSSVIIICIVISIILCIFGSVKKVNETDGKVEGNGLVANIANTMTDTIDTYQKQIIPNENLFFNNNFRFVYWDYTISGSISPKYTKSVEYINGKETSIYTIPTKKEYGNYFYTSLNDFIHPTSGDGIKTYTFSFNVSSNKKTPFSFISINNFQLIYSSLSQQNEFIDETPRRVVVKFKINPSKQAANYNCHWSLRDSSKDYTAVVKIDSMKLEEGNKVTPLN